ncbi:hypothetical protein C8F04DRAFT_104447 [Mycena alexandri]|uniref:Uncharacterized protein n=1 Tax=Mycena alexandri TaxID=1745969 RepID=A0AAD6SF18_9AGAR|nr:hypothetical protein C8F04DRAFT_104447 [Mycena alexandri]
MSTLAGAFMLQFCSFGYINAFGVFQVYLCHIYRTSRGCRIDTCKDRLTRSPVHLAQSSQSPLVDHWLDLLCLLLIHNPTSAALPGLPCSSSRHGHILCADILPVLHNRQPLFSIPPPSPSLPPAPPAEASFSPLCLIKLDRGCT